MSQLAVALSLFAVKKTTKHKKTPPTKAPEEGPIVVDTCVLVKTVAADVFKHCVTQPNKAAAINPYCVNQHIIWLAAVRECDESKSHKASRRYMKPW